MRHLITVSLIVTFLAPAAVHAGGPQFKKITPSSGSTSYRKSIWQKRRYKKSVTRRHARRRNRFRIRPWRRTSLSPNHRRSIRNRPHLTNRHASRSGRLRTRSFMMHQRHQARPAANPHAMDRQHQAGSTNRHALRQQRRPGHMNPGASTRRQRRLDYGMAPRHRQQWAQQRLTDARRLEGPRFRIFRTGQRRGSLRRLGNLLQFGQPFQPRHATNVQPAE
jgi:hypothetical protein